MCVCVYVCVCMHKCKVYNVHTCTRVYVDYEFSTYIVHVGHEGKRQNDEFKMEGKDSSKEKRKRRSG